MDRERQTLGERGLAHAGLADEHRIVLAPAEQDMDRAFDFILAPDQRIDLALGGAFGKVYRVALERACRRKFRRAFLILVALAFFVIVLVLALGLALVGAAHLPIVVRADLGDAVRDEVDYVEAGDAFLLQEVEGVRLGLLEHRDQHRRTVYFLAPRRLRVHCRALQRALHAGRVARRCVGAAAKALDPVIEVALQFAAQRIDIRRRTA